MSDEEKTLAKYNCTALQRLKYTSTPVCWQGQIWNSVQKFVAVKTMAYKGIIIKNSNQQMTEVDILTRLNHENIVRIKDNFEYRE